MFKDLLELGNNGVYAIVSTSLFFLLFLGVAIWVIFMKKSHTTKMSNLPLEDGTPSSAQHEDRP
jgi:hypothetical protein